MDIQSLELGGVIVLSAGMLQILKAVVLKAMSRNGAVTNRGVLTDKQNMILHDLHTSHLGEGTTRPDGTRRWWFPDGSVDTMIQLQRDTLTEIRQLRKDLSS